MTGNEITNYLAEMDQIVDELGDVYTPEGVAIWLGSRNANLNGEVPAALMTTPEGRARVREQVDRLAGGPRTDGVSLA